MARILLFHSALGLRPAVRDAAARLREAGHEVILPDYYGGQTFDTVDAGVVQRDVIGHPELMRRWHQAVEGLPGDLVYAGLSLGALPATLFAGTRPGARAAILLHGAVIPSDLGISRWPAHVPVQVHRAERDPWVESGEVEMVRREVEAAGTGFGEYVYPGDVHLFDDPGVQGHDPKSAAELWARVLEFLRRLDAL